jgi:hypothetical protein
MEFLNWVPDRCDFGYFDGAALCATSAAERRQAKSGCTKSRRHHGSDKTKTQTYCQIDETRGRS